MTLYVSSELTHFVGAGEPSDEERYLLLTKILRSGKLLDGRSLRRPKKRRVSFLDIEDDDGTVEHQNFFAEPYFDTNIRAQLASNDFVRPDMVCFCDIPYDPPEFFRIHTAKYNRFGVAFDRSFLVPQGASPVFYVARSATTSMRLIGDSGPHTDFYLDETYPTLFGKGRTRGELFTEMASRLLELVDKSGAEAQQHLDAYQVDSSDKQAAKLSMYRALDLPMTMFAYLFGYMKFFDPTLADAHPDNFYMEREWRVLGEVRFGLPDVARILLPPEYVDRFKNDLPEYAAPVLQLPPPSAR